MSKTMQDKETKDYELREAIKKDFKGLYVREFTMGWKEQRFLRNIELDIMQLGDTKKYISRIEQEAERRGAINILKKVRDNADELYDEERDWHEVLFGVLEAELKLLEEENGKQNAR